jgi:hypothetical protein
MFMSVLYSWAHFLAGVVAGCWIGVIVGCGVALLLAGRRVRQLEAANLLLRVQLHARREQQPGGLRAIGHGLALPRSGGSRKADARMSRIARVN